MMDMKYFEIETKVRKMVAEMLGPLSERTNSNFHEIEDMKRKYEQLAVKNGELERIIKQDLNLRQNLTDFKKKISQMDSDFQNQLQKMGLRCEQLSQSNSLYNEKFNQFVKEKSIFLSIKDSLQKDLSNFDQLLSKFKSQVNDQMMKMKEEVDGEVNELYKICNKVETDTNTNRALIKGQNEQFSQINYQIEISKYNIERVREKVESLNFLEELEKTENYLQKFMPYKIQNMIDDTLFNILELEELEKLAQYEEKVFSYLDINRVTLKSKLQREEFERPDRGLRLLLLQKLSADRAAQMLLNGEPLQKRISRSFQHSPHNERIQVQRNADIAPLLTSQETMNSQLSNMNKPTQQSALEVQSARINNRDSKANQLLLQQDYSNHLKQHTMDLRSIQNKLSEQINSNSVTQEVEQKYQPKFLSPHQSVIENQDDFKFSNYPSIQINEDQTNPENEYLRQKSKNNVGKKKSFYQLYSQVETDIQKQIEQGIDVSKEFKQQEVIQQYQTQYKHELRSSSSRPSQNRFGKGGKSHENSIRQSARENSVPAKLNNDYMIIQDEAQFKQNLLNVPDGGTNDSQEQIQRLTSRDETQLFKQGRISPYYISKKDTDEFNKEQEDLDNDLLNNQESIPTSRDYPFQNTTQEIRQPITAKMKEPMSLQVTPIIQMKQNVRTRVNDTEQSHIKSPPIPQFQQNQSAVYQPSLIMNQSLNKSLDGGLQSTKSIQDQKYSEMKKSMMIQIEKQQALRKKLYEIKGGRLSQKDVDTDILKRISQKTSSKGSNKLDDIMGTVNEEFVTFNEQNTQQNKGSKANQIKNTNRNQGNMSEQSFGDNQERNTIRQSILSQYGPESVKEIIKDIQNQLNDFKFEFKKFQTSILQQQELIQAENDQIFAQTTTQIKDDITKLNEAFEEVKGEFQEEKKRRIREKNEIMNEFNIIKTKFQEGQTDVSQVLEQNDSIVQLINALISAYKIQQALDYQDEIDRESIFLMGAKETFPSPFKQDPQGSGNEKFPNYPSSQTARRKDYSGNRHQVLSLDKNCITCSQGAITTALNAFKIACLTYTPSTVEFEHKSFTRKELIEKKGDIINLCQQHSYDPDPQILEQGLKSILYLKQICLPSAGTVKRFSNLGMQQTRYPSKQSQLSKQKHPKYTKRRSPQVELNSSVYISNAVSQEKSKEDLLTKNNSVELEQPSSTMRFNELLVGGSAFVLKQKGEEMKKAIIAQQKYQVNPQMYKSHQGSFKMNPTFFSPQKPKSRKYKEVTEERSSVSRDNSALLPTLQKNN